MSRTMMLLTIVKEASIKDNYLVLGADTMMK